MKNLDLNKYGVQAMNTNEMKETEGGSLFAAAIITLAVLYLAGTCIGLAEGHRFNGQP